MGRIRFKKKNPVKDKELGAFVASVLMKDPKWDKSRFAQVSF